MNANSDTLIFDFPEYEGVNQDCKEGNEYPKVDSTNASSFIFETNNSSYDEVIEETIEFDVGDDDSEDNNDDDDSKYYENDNDVGDDDSDDNNDDGNDQVNGEKKSKRIIDGCRIVNYEHVIKDLLNKAYDKSLHEESCTLNKLELVNSRKKGFIEDVFLQCITCKVKVKYCSQPEDTDSLNINDAMVLGSLTAGSGFSNMQELLAPVGIPSMSSTKYLETQRRIVKSIIETSEETMLKNIEEEKRLSKEAGNVIYYAAADGMITEIIYTTVMCDGSWMQRTYPGTSFDSLAGTVAVLGKYTNCKKPLGVIVKCKTYAKCDSRKEYINDHDCYKSFPRNESSSSMEKVGALEILRDSWLKHKLVYKYFIGDGDSSVYSAILADDPYAEFGIRVEKYEDINHKCKGNVKGIKNLSKKGFSKEEKKWYNFVSTHSLEIHFEIIDAINRRISQDVNCSLEENLEILRDEILNVPYHVFGDRSKCKKFGGWSCDGVDAKDENNYVPYLEKYGIMTELLDLQKNLCLNTKSLFLKTTTNLVENLNSIICKYIAGKRIAFCFSGSFAGRVNAAVIKCSEKRVQSAVIEHLGKTVPSEFLKVKNERKIKVERNKQYHSKKRRFKRYNTGNDKDYDETA